jgi:hypothetical protein
LREHPKKKFHYCSIQCFNRSRIRVGPFERGGLEEARFWARVDKSNSDGCWIWKGARCRLGYGRVWVARGPKKRQKLLAHRISYAIKSGPIPPGKFVCHRCDNPSCVNPEHLFLGTQKENMADMVSKDRRHRKLSENDVLDMKVLHAIARLTPRKLARLFDVSLSHVSRALSNKPHRARPRVPWPAYTAGKALSLEPSIGE